MTLAFVVAHSCARNSPVHATTATSVVAARKRSGSNPARAGTDDQKNFIAYSRGVGGFVSSAIIVGGFPVLGSASRGAKGLGGGIGAAGGLR